jgi:hypothetical protein
MYRINKLLKQKEKLFHTQDLGILWGIDNKNTLYTTIKRDVSRGILIPIHKGYYSTVPLKEIDPMKLAIGFIHDYAYVSCETVLTRGNVIFQKTQYLTLVSGISRKFAFQGNYFLVRKMRDEYLYNNLGITETEGVKTASLERAVADIMYYNPKAFFDNRKTVNWNKVRQIRKEVFNL